MLTEEEFGEACFLHSRLVARRGYLGKVDALLDLIRRASPEQRRVFAGEKNPELRRAAVETALRFSWAALGLVDEMPSSSPDQIRRTSEKGVGHGRA